MKSFYNKYGAANGPDALEVFHKTDDFISKMIGLFVEGEGYSVHELELLIIHEIGNKCAEHTIIKASKMLKAEREDKD